MFYHRFLSINKYICIVMKTYRFALLKEILSDFGELVKKNRIDRNLTQKELAHQLGISSNQVAIIEKTGNTSMLTLVKILKKFEKIDSFMDMLDVPDDFNPYDIKPKKEKLRVKHSKKDGCK